MPIKFLAPLLFLLALQRPVQAQSIAGTNLAHWYNPSNEVEFTWKLVNGTDSLSVFYKFQVVGPLVATDYTIEWEKRQSYGQRKGDSIPSPAEVMYSDVKSEVGKISLAKPTEPWLLVAKVINLQTKASQLYFKKMEATYPIDGYLSLDDSVAFQHYVTTEDRVTLRSVQDKKDMVVFRYRIDFTPASPPFAEKENRVASLLQADSVFRATAESQRFGPGLYLVQADSNSVRGFSFLVTDPAYPGFARVEDLAPPLIFICTKEEFERLKNAGSNKKEIDKVILEITGNTERAKNFMRSYFRRVELANRYFTSYKEGWKTDRGMIYLIFGAPDEVNCTGDNEIWNYESQKVRFTFLKSGSIYDPDNFVLVRDKRFGVTWFNTIDMWRKSRF